MNIMTRGNDDPILGHIEGYWRAYEAVDAAIAEQSRLEEQREPTDAIDREIKRQMALRDTAALAMLDTAPTTLEGVAAALDFAAGFEPGSHWSVERLAEPDDSGRRFAPAEVDRSELAFGRQLTRQVAAAVRSGVEWHGITARLEQLEAEDKETADAIVAFVDRHGRAFDWLVRGDIGSVASRLAHLQREVASRLAHHRDRGSEVDGPDPVFALIEAHRQAADEDNALPTSASRSAQDAAKRKADEAAFALLDAAPTTLAGLTALARYGTESDLREGWLVTVIEGPEGRRYVSGGQNPRDYLSHLMRTLARSLERISAAPAAREPAGAAS